MSQSQKSLAKNVLSWSRTHCEEQFHTAVPSLIQELITSNNQIETLCTLYTKFVVAAKLKEVEEMIWAQTADYVIATFDDALDEIARIVKTQSKLDEAQMCVKEAFQKALKVISSLEACLQHIQTAGEDFRLADVHSLLQVVLHVILKSYDHCKKSSTEYGDLLSTFSQQLSATFKQVHALQMAVLGLLERAKLDSSICEEDLEDLCFVLQKLHEIAEVAQTLDVKVTITIWKTFSKLACQLKAQLIKKLDMSVIVTSLCNNMTTTFKYMIENLPKTTEASDPKSKVLNKNVRVLGFQMKIVVRLCEEYACTLDESACQGLVHLCLQIQRHSPPSLLAQEYPEMCTGEISSQLTLALPVLLRHLIQCSSLSKCLLQRPSTEDQGLPWCLLLLHIADNLTGLTEDRQHAWLMTVQSDKGERRAPSLFHAIFEAFSQCFVECYEASWVSLPSTQHSGQQVRLISLYQHVYVKHCVLVAALPASFFHSLEECLLVNILQTQQLRALLAVDVWCFVARFGSAELCAQHCVLLTDLFLTLPLGGAASTHLQLLLSRLLKFFAPEHQQMYVDKYPVKDNLALWAIIPVNAFGGATGSKIADDLFKMAGESMRRICEYGSTTAMELLDLKLKLDGVVNLLRHANESNDSPVTDDHVTSLTNQLSAFISRMTSLESHMLESGLLCSCGAVALEVTSYIAPCMSNSQHVKILEFMNLYATTSHADVKMATLSVLGSFSYVTFPPSSHQTFILETITRLFKILLAESHVIVNQSALSVFADFAERTQHENIVPACLETNQDVHNTVVSYLNRIASKDPVQITITPADVLKDIGRLKAYWLRPTPLTPASPSDALFFIEPSAEEPRAKRTRENGDELPVDTFQLQDRENTEAKTIIDSIASELVELKQKTVSPLPSWLKEKLTRLRDQINELLAEK